MIDPTQLTALEVLLVTALAGVMGWEVLRCWSSREPLAAFRPTVVLAVILAYYCLLGPLLGLASGAWAPGGVSLRSGMVWGWTGALVFFLSVMLGFYGLKPWRLPRTSLRQLSPEWCRRIGRWLNFVGFGLQVVAQGPLVLAQLNPLAAASLGEELQGWGLSGGLGVLNSLLQFSLNLLVPGTLLLFAAAIHRRKGWPEVILWSLIAAALYTTSGFRWRLVVLLVPMVILWYLCRQRRPRLVVMALFASGLIALAGFIGLTRTYGQGLDISQAGDLGAEQVIDSGLFESTVFYTTGEVIRLTPQRISYIGLTPLVGALGIFIPRAIWPDKPSAEYISTATTAVYGNTVYAAGSAFLSYAEYFMVFGWPSLIAISILLGWLLRCLNAWFLEHRFDPSAQVAYVLTSAFLYVVVSRGYLPQVALLFIFTVLPIFLIRRIA